MQLESMPTVLAFDHDTMLVALGACWGNRFPSVVLLSDVAPSKCFTIYVSNTFVSKLTGLHPDKLSEFPLQFHFTNFLSLQHHLAILLSTFGPIVPRYSGRRMTEGNFYNHIHSSMRTQLFITTLLVAATSLVASAPRYVRCHPVLALVG
jgi:hypothetical protein